MSVLTEGIIFTLFFGLIMYGIFDTFYRDEK